MKKIFILLGHPDNDSFNCTLADEYQRGAEEVGHDVRRVNIGEMQFDPILHRGYRARQELEPDLVRFHQLITESEHFVIIYPVWWVGMPALLKGLFDRAWLPGSAFRYIKLASGKRTPFWHRMFRGKTARTILASGTHPLLVRLLPGNVNAQLRWGLLWFAGFSVRSMWLGPSENVPPKRKERWLAKVRALGSSGS